MPVQTKCNQCDQTIKAGESAAGHSVACPSCGAEVVLPAQAEEQPIVGGLAPKEAAQIRPWSDPAAASIQPTPPQRAGSPRASRPLWIFALLLGLGGLVTLIASALL